MNSTKKKLLATACVMMLLATAFGVTMDEDVTEEEDAFALSGTAIAFIIGELAVAGAGALIAWAVLTHLNGGSGGEEDQRNNDAITVAQMMIEGLNDQDVAFQNYENIWKFTTEHWTRQAELAASASWSADATWSVDDILKTSTTYSNSSMVMLNAVAQLNANLDMVYDHMQLWNNNSTYSNGKMKISIDYGSNNITVDSSNLLDIEFGTYATPTAIKNQVVYTGGPIVATKSGTIAYEMTSGTNTITGAFQVTAGVPYTLFDQHEDKFAILTLPDSGGYFGNLLGMIGTKASACETAIQIQKDSTYTYLYATDWYKADSSTYSVKLTDGTTKYTNFELKIITAGGHQTDSVDFMDAFTAYTNLYKRVESVMEDAAQKAEACWTIFEGAGEANPLLTTLMVPETYENMTLTAAQQRLITILAMQQLAEYSNTHDFDAQNVDLTMRSMTTYCRGTVSLPTDTYGNLTAYEDVIFTPIFYTNTTLTKNTTNTLPEYGFIAIWSKGKNLETFDTTNLSDCDLIYVQSGAKLDITEILYNGVSVDSVTLKVDKVNVIDPKPTPIPTPPDPDEHKYAEIVMIILAIIGAALVFLGITRANMVYIVIGILIIVAGYFAADFISDLIEKLLNLLDFASWF